MSHHQLPVPLISFILLILLIIFSFPASAASVSIAKPGSGGGIIDSNPSGITCGSDCSGTFLPFLALTLTANPDAYSSFVAWQGGFCDGQNSTCAYTFGPPLPPLMIPMTL